MKYVDGVPEYKGAGDVLAKVTCRFSDLNQTLTYLCTFHISGKKLSKKYYFPFQVIKNEGFFSLWKGFTPYYFRLGPHTVLTFIFLEQVTVTPQVLLTIS